METKKIADSLRCCVSSESCKSCGFLDNQQCRITMKIIAANRLEELETEIADLKKQLSEQQTAWISVEDEPFPGLSHECSSMWYLKPGEPCYYVYCKDAEGTDFTHWMRLEPPKPKELTFKAVFLEKFPKAKILNPAVTIYCCDVFPWLVDENGCRQTDMVCEECWSQPYFEEEGEQK